MKCAKCGKYCRSVVLDFGIGKTEYFGAVATDTDIQQVSGCCNAPLTDDDGELLDAGWDKPNKEDEE